MTADYFVDTNVLVYARDASEPVKQPLAQAWLRHLWQSRTGRLSTQVLSEYYVTVTRKLSRPIGAEEAWDDVRCYLAWSPLAIDAAVLVQGRAIQARHRLSWWDSLIVAGAVASGASVLLTEDLQDGSSLDGVRIANPFRKAPPPVMASK